MLDEEAGVTTRQRSGPSYGNRLQNYLRRRGGHAATVDLPSFAPSSALRHTTGFRGLLHALEQSGVQITKEQLEVATVIERRKDNRKEWASSKQGKARRKHRTNLKSIEQVRDEASERVCPTYVSAGFGGSGAGSNDNARKQKQCSN